MKDYLSTLQNKNLNEVVIPGSHDAGIFGQGKDNVVTQALDIGGQAEAGVRFFDLRIATNLTGSGSSATYTPRAYHLDTKLVVNLGHQNVSHLGGWGGGLEDMLKQARDFVQGNQSEFLILKFSKSYGLELIIEMCRATLGTAHFNPRAKVNLNMMKVSSLAGKVITLFDPKELAKLKLNNSDHRYSGILPYHELYDKKTESSKCYQPYGHGLQYFGKFSSTSNVDKNTRKQSRIIENGALGADRNAMGMMYWTTTGMFGSIKARNEKMWTVSNVMALQRTWESGLSQAVRTQMGRDFGIHRQFQEVGRGGSAIWKAFMPNIVMMDFADSDKCRTVFELNTVASNQIADYVDTFGFMFE